MRTLRAALRRFTGLFTRRQQDADFAAELDAHLALHIDDGIRSGLTPAEARRQALIRLGGIEPVRESYRDRAGIPLVDGLFQDIRYGVRRLRKERRFTFVAILTLALGVGVNTAVFSVVNAVLLRPLPFPKPGQIVRIARQTENSAVNMAEYRFAKEHAEPFVSVTAHRNVGNRSLGTGPDREWIGVMPVGTAFFQTLGAPLETGREFTGAEVAQNGPPAVILTRSLWRRLVGADSGIVGRSVILDDKPFTVIGVLPVSFWFPENPEAFVPLQSADQGANTHLIARLKDNVSLRQAQAALNVSSEALRRNRPEGIPNGYRGLTALSWHDWLVGDVRPKLVILAGAVAGLLLIACANLAGLLLARLAARQKETAVRLALGCSWARLLRQLMVENMMLGIAGGSIGLVAAWWSLDAIVAAIPFPLTTQGGVSMDWRVLVVSLATVLVASIAIGLTPFFCSSGVQLRDTLQSSGRTGSAGHGSGYIGQRARGALVVTEIAVSVTLLVAAALLIESLYRLHRERLGFEPHGLITFWTPATPERRAKPERLRAFDAQVLERVRGIPGVRSAATVSLLPLTGHSNLPAEPVGYPDRAIGGTEFRVVSSGYFATAGIQIVSGRSLLEQDIATAPPVILVNETAARAWWPDGRALVSRVAVGRFHGKDYANGQEPERSVIGIVADTKSEYVNQPPKPTVYLPAAQALWYDSPMNWVVRAEPGVAGAIQRAIAEIDPHQRVERLRTMDAIVASTTADSRFDAWLFGAFAALALLLSAIGVYGLLSFSVALRTSEIGTRMALGASREQVLRLVLGQGVVLTGIGLAAGLGGAILLSRSLQSLLFGVRPTDPWTFAAVSASLLCTGLLASYIPARRATKVDPMIALRCE